MANELWRPKYSNCFFWAIYARYIGLGKIKIRLSVRWIRGSHIYIQTPEGAKLSYEPLNKDDISFWGGLAEILFRGEVVCEIREKETDDG